MHGRTRCNTPHQLVVGISLDQMGHGSMPDNHTVTWPSAAMQLQLQKSMVYTYLRRYVYISEVEVAAGLDVLRSKHDAA